VVDGFPYDTLLKDVKEFAEKTKFNLLIVYNNNQDKEDGEATFNSICFRFREYGLIDDAEQNR
jgi:hypothetical protein